MDRRSMLVGSTAWLAGCAASAANAHSTAVGSPSSSSAPPGGAQHGYVEAQEVTPAEDLMQEHGLLRRALLVYAEGAHRLETAAPLAAAPMRRAVELVRDFVHAYHEVNEEQHIFPRAERTNELRGLVAILRVQHDAGRAVTAALLEDLTDVAWNDSARRARVAPRLRDFVRMYYPHAAREDTVLFPASRALFSHAEWKDLGEIGEHEETVHFGEGGFERMVGVIDTVERELGINDLAQFTPPHP